MARLGLTDRTPSGPQSGIAALGVMLGVGLALFGWHAAHSNYANGYVLADPSKDAHLHAFGHWLLPLGLILFAASLALAVSGFRRPQPRWALVLTVGLVVAGLVGFIYGEVHYSSLSSMCACAGG